MDATKVRQGREEALALASTVKKIITAKGKSIVTVDLTKDPPDAETLASLLLGPTGNLRAPTLKVGNTLLVGFQEDAYRQVFQSR